MFICLCNEIVNSISNAKYLNICVVLLARLYKVQVELLYSLFSSPVQSTGRAIVLTLASAFAFALALVLALAFPSRHF